MKKIIVKNTYNVIDVMNFIEKQRQILDIENSPESIHIDLENITCMHISIVGFVFEIYSTCKNKNIPCQIIPPVNKNIKRFFSPILEVE